MWDSNAKDLKKGMELILGTKVIEDEIVFRHMFGGILAYTFGRPFASLSNAGIALKLSDTDKDRLIKEKGGYPLRYKPDDPPSKNYTVLPLAIVEANSSDCEYWLTTSIKHCKSLPLKKKKARKPKAS